MGHTFQISDEEYAKLAAYAAKQGQSPEMLFLECVRAITRDMEKIASVSSGRPMVQERLAGDEEEVLNSPLFQVAGMFAIDEQGWADRHDEYLAETYLENHAEDE